MPNVTRIAAKGYVNGQAGAGRTRPRTAAGVSAGHGPVNPERDGGTTGRGGFQGFGHAVEPARHDGRDVRTAAVAARSGR